MTLLVLLFRAPTSVFAQGHIAAAAPSIAPAPGFLTSYNFHLNAGFLSIDDPRFSWDTDFGGDLDLVDYGRGRVNFLANYEAILGTAQRATDPSQGNYTLDGSASIRFGRNEVAAILHHLSRHLADRAKPFGISWNAVGLTYGRVAETQRLHLESQARLVRTINKAYLDYESELWGKISAEYRLGDRAVVIGRAEGAVVGVDPAVARRDDQRGGALEGAVRIHGRRAALELFLTIERRIDADAIERLPQNWLMTGFRLLGK